MRNFAFAPLEPHAYGAIVIDPPGLFKIRSAKGEGKSPQAQYPCMADEEILRLPVRELAGDDCWLFLWTMAPKLDFAFACLDAWGFAYISRLGWRKLTINGKPRMGPGYVVRTLHEDVLIAKVGKPRRRRALPSIIDGVAREHSRKPDAFYDHCDRFLPLGARRCDVFSRESRPGWETWGNEAGKFDARVA